MLAVTVFQSISAVFFTLFALLLMAVILLQRGRGVGLAGAFGGGGAATAFGAKTGDFLTWVTIVMFGIYVFLAVLLNYIFSPSLSSLAAGAAVEEAAPAAQTETIPATAPVEMTPMPPTSAPVTLPATPPASEPSPTAVETAPPPTEGSEVNPATTTSAPPPPEPATLSDTATSPPALNPPADGTATPGAVPMPAAEAPASAPIGEAPAKPKG